MNDPDTIRDPVSVSERDLRETRTAFRDGVRIGLFSIFGVVFLVVLLMLATGSSTFAGSTGGSIVVLALLATALFALVRWSWRA